MESPANDSVVIATPTACEPGRHSPNSIARGRKNAASPPADRLVSFLPYPKVSDADSSPVHHTRVSSRAHTPSSSFRLEYAEERGPVGPTARRIRAQAQHVPPDHLAWTRYACRESSPPLSQE